LPSYSKRIRREINEMIAIYLEDTQTKKNVRLTSTEKYFGVT
jgi:hypothetical protein